MKKLLTILIALLLFIPMVVRADIEILYLYYNRNVNTCGELQINVPVSYDREYNMTIKYDTEYLSIKEDMIELSESDSKNVKSVSIENGKITLRAKIHEPEGVMNDYPNPYIVLRFTAKKEGKTTVEFNAGSGVVIGNAKVTISKLGDECFECSNKEETKEEEKEEQKEEKKQENNTNINKNTNTNTTKCKTNMLPFYISLIINGILLILLVILALKKSKKKQSGMYDYN